MKKILTFFFSIFALMAGAQSVVITQSGTGSGIDTSYQIGDSIYIVAGGTDTIFTGVAVSGGGGGGSGTVTSVAATVPTGLAVTGSPITTSGTLAITNNLAAGIVKSSGVGLSFTSGLVDIISETTGTLTPARGGTGLTALGTGNQMLRINAGATALEYFTPSFPTGSGASGQVTYWTGTSTQSGNAGFTYTAAKNTIIVPNAKTIAGTEQSSTTTAPEVIGGYMESSAATGAIEITLPPCFDSVGFGIHVLSFVLEVNSFNKGIFQVPVLGYVDNGVFYSQSNAYIVGKSEQSPGNIRFGMEGGRHKIWVGELGTSYGTMTAHIRDVQNYRLSGTVVQLFHIASGWAIAMENTAFGTVNDTEIMRPQFSDNKVVDVTGGYGHIARNKPITAHAYNGGFTGAHEITLPPSTTTLASAGVDFVISGVLNTSSLSNWRVFLISANYNYSTRNFANVFVTWEGGQIPGLTFRFGDDGTNGKIWVGDIATVWTGADIALFDLRTIGSSEAVFDEFSKNWSIGSETSAFNNVDATFTPASAGAVPYTSSAGFAYSSGLNYDGTNLSAGAVRFGDGSAATPSGTFTNDTNTGFFHPTTDVYAISTGGAEQMRINVLGNVGIANTAPSEKLDVTGNIRFSGALMPNNAAGTSGQVLTSAGAGAPPTWASAGTIGGTAAAGRVAYGDGSNSLTSSANFTYGSSRLESASSSGASLRASYSLGAVYTDFGTNSAGYGYLSPTGKRLGINTTAPSATVHAQNDGNGTQKAVILDHNSGTMSTGEEFQIDLSLGGTAMARVSAVKEASGYGLKFFTGGSAAVNSTPIISATGSNNITIGDASVATIGITGNDIAIGSTGDDITIGNTGAGASTNFQGNIGLDDYVEETANSGTLTAKAWHYIDPTGAATRTLPSSMNDGAWIIVVNLDPTFDITISAPAGETLAGSATITATKTGFFAKKGTVWVRISF